jgi:hypothetical protein
MTYSYFIVPGAAINLHTFGNVNAPIVELETQNELIALPGGGFVAKFTSEAPFAPRQLAMAALINEENAIQLRNLAGIIGRLYRYDSKYAKAELKHVLISPSGPLNQATSLYTVSLVFLLFDFWNGGMETYIGTFNGSNEMYYHVVENGDHWVQSAKFECYCIDGLVSQVSFNNGHQLAVWQGQLQGNQRLVIDDETKSVTVNAIDSYSGFSRVFHGTKLRGGDWLAIPPNGGHIEVIISGASLRSGTYQISYDKRHKSFL